MRFSQGGLRLDPARGLELSTLDREPKRSNASGVGQVHPDSAFPAAKIYQTVAQSIPTGGANFTTVTMDSEMFDNDGIGDLANDAIVAKFPGIYHVVGLVTFAVAAGGGYRFAGLQLNGTAFGQAGPLTPGTGHIARVVCHDMVSLARGDVLKLQAWQDSGAGLLTVVTLNLRSFLAAFWVGPS